MFHQIPKYRDIMAIKYSELSLRENEVLNLPIWVLKICPLSTLPGTPSFPPPCQTHTLFLIWPRDKTNNKPDMSLSYFSSLTSCIPASCPWESKSKQEKLLTWEGCQRKLLTFNKKSLPREKDSFYWNICSVHNFQFQWNYLHIFATIIMVTDFLGSVKHKNFFKGIQGIRRTICLSWREINKIILL